MFATAVLLLLSSPSSGDEVRAPQFLLPDTEGDRVSLIVPDDPPPCTVVCAPGDAAPAWELMATAGDKLAEQGLRVLMLVRDLPAAAERASEGLRILHDARADVRHRLGLVEPGATLVLDRELRIVWKGTRPDQQRAAFLGAVSATLEGLEADDFLAPFPARPPLEQPTPEFWPDVASIVHQHCADCHRPGQVGPMSLLDPAEAQGWAPMIAEVVRDGSMPPWHADPRYGEFRNERRLDDNEKAILAAWSEGGAPIGDPAAAPPAPEWDDEGWKIGSPDHIIQIPEAQDVPATGFLPYRHITIDAEIDEDRWVQAVEVRPTNPAVVHHILAILVPPVTHLKMLRGTQFQGGFVERGYYAVNVPGDRPNIYPPGQGKFLPKGSRFLLQIHYQPIGVAASDQTRVGFVWADEPPEQQVITKGITNMRMRIPPYEANATFEAEYEFPRDSLLTSLFPHMHLRGKAFRYEHLRADGSRRTVLDVPEYDFNWQAFYDLEVPLPIRAGEKLRCTAVYDNSEDNPFNPAPEKWVRWGDQTYDEMLIGYIDFVETEAEDAEGR